VPSISIWPEVGPSRLQSSSRSLWERSSVDENRSAGVTTSQSGISAGQRISVAIELAVTVFCTLGERPNPICSLTEGLLRWGYTMHISR